MVLGISLAYSIKLIVFIFIVVWGIYNLYFTKPEKNHNGGYIDLGIIDNFWSLRYPFIALLLWLTASTFLF